MLSYPTIEAIQYNCHHKFSVVKFTQSKTELKTTVDQMKFDDFDCFSDSQRYGGVQK